MQRYGCMCTMNHAKCQFPTHFRKSIYCPSECNSKTAHLPPYARAMNGVGRVPDGTLLEVAFFEPL